MAPLGARPVHPLGVDDAVDPGLPGRPQIEAILEQLALQVPAQAVQAGLQLVMREPGSVPAAQEPDQPRIQPVGGGEAVGDAGAGGVPQLPGGRRPNRVISSFSPALPCRSRSARAARNRSVAARTASTSPAGRGTSLVRLPSEKLNTTDSCNASPAAHRQFGFPQRRRCVTTEPRTIVGSCCALRDTTHTLLTPTCQRSTARFSVKAAPKWGCWALSQPQPDRSTALNSRYGTRPAPRKEPQPYRWWASRRPTSLARPEEEMGPMWRSRMRPPGETNTVVGRPLTP